MSVNDCFRPVSRYWDRINRPEQLLAALPEAMRVLADPAETGAVTLALPAGRAGGGLRLSRRTSSTRACTWWRGRAPTPRRCAAAAALLRAAQRPLIVAGGGVYYSEAEAALRAFAEAHRASRWR